MAFTTQVYKEEAIALRHENHSFRAIAEMLATKYGAPVVSHMTISKWVDKEKTQTN